MIHSIKSFSKVLEERYSKFTIIKAFGNLFKEVN